MKRALMLPLLIFLPLVSSVGPAWSGGAAPGWVKAIPADFEARWIEQTLSRRESLWHNGKKAVGGLGFDVALDEAPRLVQRTFPDTFSNMNHQRISARTEDAIFVEHRVVGQVVLVVDTDDAAILQHGSRVVSDRARGVCAVGEFMDGTMSKTHNDGDCSRAGSGNLACHGL